MSQEKNEYFKFLKENSDSVQEAYRRYALEKFIWRHFAVNPHASEEVKQAFELQEQINDYCVQLVKNPDLTFMEHQNLNNDTVLDFVKEKQKAFYFLSIDRQEMLSLVTGTYVTTLKIAGNQVKSWETLEQLMNEEKNTVLPEMNRAQLDKGFNELIDNYALESIVISKAKSTASRIEQISENCASLSQVIGCQPQQIGINRYNIALDIEDDPNAGYLGSHFTGSKKLYLNSYLMHDAFAHEWLHGMDTIWGDHVQSDNYFMSTQSEGPIKELLDAGMQADKKAIKKVKSQINDKMAQYIDEIVERYNRGGHISNASEVKEKCLEICEKIQAGKNWDKHKVATMLNSYTTSSCPKSFAPYMITEMEIMEHVNFSKKFDESLFYEYAKKMDKNLVNIGKLDGFDEYSKSPEERFARMFESYVELVLQEKGIDNHISYTKGNSYTPRLEEVKTYRNKWDDLMVSFREVLDEIYPVEKKKELIDVSHHDSKQTDTSGATDNSVKEVANTIGNLREKFLNNAKSAVKYK